MTTSASIRLDPHSPQCRKPVKRSASHAKHMPIDSFALSASIAAASAVSVAVGEVTTVVASFETNSELETPHHVQKAHPSSTGLLQFPHSVATRGPTTRIMRSIALRVADNEVSGEMSSPHSPQKAVSLTSSLPHARHKSRAAATSDSVRSAPDRCCSGKFAAASVSMRRSRCSASVGKSRSSIAPATSDTLRWSTSSCSAPSDPVKRSLCSASAGTPRFANRSKFSTPTSPVKRSPASLSASVRAATLEPPATSPPSCTTTSLD
mmetsp:Transcript_6946/g.23066  ORF Transcript_6946/g.23066 Transcript_6946/m.23066 type:complete len:265 (+) Transcript_6946:50-844(+)